MESSLYGQERPITTGDKIRFFDKRGRFIFGQVLEGGELRVVASNVTDRGRILSKHPFWSWEQSVQLKDGSTALRPHELLALADLWSED